MKQYINTIRHYDYRSYLWLHKQYQNSAFLTFFFEFFAKYGILISFLSFIYLIWTRKINALICSGFSMGIAGTIDLIIYLFWKRPRPYITHSEVVDLDPHGFTVDIASFPSSHTYLSFAIATSVFLYGHKKLGSFLFIVALLIAISRISIGLHYPSDTIGGALLGVSAGIFAYIIVHKSEKYWE